MFNMNDAQFTNCNVQINANDGTQINGGISEAVSTDINKICLELECIAAENETVKNTIQEIRAEIEKGTSKNKINSLLSALKNAISLLTVVEKFPNIVDKVKLMIEKIIG